MNQNMGLKPAVAPHCDGFACPPATDQKNPSRELRLKNCPDCLAHPGCSFCRQCRWEGCGLRKTTCPLLLRPPSSCCCFLPWYQTSIFKSHCGLRTSGSSGSFWVLAPDWDHWATLPWPLSNSQLLPPAPSPPPQWEIAIGETPPTIEVSASRT